MSDLIERLSQATGPSRELDEAIHEVMFGPLTYTFVVETGGRGPEHYTASIDAALTLVRDTDDIDSYDLICDCGSWFVKFSTLVSGGSWLETQTIEGSDDPALEFCLQYFQHIAALKARTHDQP